MQRRLPSRKLTTSSAVYIREWKRVIAPLLRQTGWKLMGFDPGFLLETGPSATVQLSVDQVADLIHAVAPL